MRRPLVPRRRRHIDPLTCRMKAEVAMLTAMVEPPSMHPAS